MKPNVFIHIGDVHLQHGSPRNPDRLAALDLILARNEQHVDLAAWLLTGDLFHMRSTIDDRNALAERLARAAAVGPVVIVRGNHDAIGDLDIFVRLKAKYPIYLVTSPTVLEVRLATGETAAIAAVPYPDKHGLVSAGVAKGDVPETAAQLLDVIFMHLAGELAHLHMAGAIPLFLGHFNVRGSIAANCQPQIGIEQEIDRLSLERLPVVYCGLGHIHEPQEVGRGVYAGSIAAMDYGEVTPRSYVQVTATRGADGAWAAAWRRLPIQTPPMYHVDGELTREAFTWQLAGDQAMPHAGPAIDWTGADIRVRVAYKASERSVLDFERVAKEFAGALRLKVEGVAVPDRELRAPDVAAATTLASKLAAYRKEPTLPPTVAAKVTLLEAHDSTTVIAAVTAQLRAIEQPERQTVAA